MNIIHNQDCIEYMRSKPARYFDMVLTSPPFKEEDVLGDYWDFYEMFFTEVSRITKNVILIIHSSTKMNEVIQRYPPLRTLIWGKGVVKYSFRYNPIFVYQNGDYKANKHIWSDAFAVSPLYGRDKSHIYQDPVRLYTALLKMFSDCQTVFDPFMGSGTTALAAIRTGKLFEGCEIDSDYYSLSLNRIKRFIEQESLCIAVEQMTIQSSGG